MDPMLVLILSPFIISIAGIVLWMLLTHAGIRVIDPMVCRDCGSKMVERYPWSKSARRYTACEVCGYLDSYLDRERVKRAQQERVS